MATRVSNMAAVIGRQAHCDLPEAVALAACDSNEGKVLDHVNPEAAIKWLVFDSEDVRYG